MEMADWSLEKVNCPVCDSPSFEVMGIRGNREYSGADPKAEPHIKTDVARCKNCGFIYTNPMIRGMEHLELEHYRNAEDYQASRVEDVSGMFRSRVNELKKLKPSGKLLDVGAGKGEFLSEAKKAGYECEGVEPSDVFCQFAEKHYGVKMHQGLLGETDSVKGNKYDLITLLHVLEHVDHPNELMETFKDYMNDDALLFIEVPNTESTFLKIIDQFYKLKGLNWSSRLSPLHAPFHKYGYNPKSLRYILESHGYEVLKLWTLSGKDRGFAKKKGVSGLLVTLRDMVTNAIDMLGNRELLCVIARQKK
jgi:SAM-dependent methyltransferase